MAVTHKEVKKILVVAIILILLILTYFILKPILLSIITGLILAFLFLPLHKWIYKHFKERNTSALAVCVVVILIIFIPLWFLVPAVIQQIFDMFNAIQGVDIRGFIENTFPTAAQEFQDQISSISITFVGKITSAALTSLTNLLIELPALLLHAAVLIFVFFFTIRDHDKLAEYVKGLSPLTKEKQKVITKQFRDITSSIIYGYIVIGIIQGIATGIGLWVAGIPNPLFFTLLATFASIIPIFGPWLVWAPAAVYLFFTGSIAMAIGFTLYSALFVSSIDNILRPYMVARKIKSSSVIVLIGMIGGLLVFGILGILLGPLILAYLIVLLNAYKNKTLSELFTSE